MKKNKIKKYITICSLSLPTILLPLTYFTSPLKLNNELNNYSYIEDDNKVFHGNDYKTLYMNNFTQPILSPNIDNPGFLGADNLNSGSIISLPNTIHWTGAGLFNQWSAKLLDHPSVNKMNFKNPVLVGALHSDNNYNPIKRNQIFAFVANGDNLSSGEYYLLRYDAITGKPIIDSNVFALPKMINAPMPSTVSNQGRAFTVTHDPFNDRYIAYYPSKVLNFKTDVFTFMINSENNLEILNNAFDFSSWRNELFNNDNILLALEPINSSFGNGNIVAIFYITSGKNSGKFKAIELNSNMSVIKKWDFDNSIAETGVEGPFSEDDNEIEINKNIINLNFLQNSFIPKIKITYSNSYEISLLFSIDDGSFNRFIRLGWKRHPSKKEMLSTNDSFGLSNDNFFTSKKSQVNPYIWIDPNSIKSDYIITTMSSTNNSNYEARKFSFVPFLNWSNYKPRIENLGVNTIPPSILNKGINSVIEYPYLNEVEIYLWSSQNNNSRLYSKINNEFIDLLNTNNGALMIVNPQTTARELGWLNGEVNSKTPSEITDEDLSKSSGNLDDKAFFKYQKTLENNFSTIVNVENVIRNDSRGTIDGIFIVRSKFSINDNLEKTYELISKIPFHVNGFEIVSKPTDIIQIGDTINIVPSSINSSNINSYFKFNNLPSDAIVSNWSITNRNNAQGSLTISIETNKWYDINNSLVNTPKTFTKYVDTFKKVSGISIKQNITNVSNLSVWDITPDNAYLYVDLLNLIPGANITTTYEILNRLPLEGKLDLKVTINGSYYNPNNNGAPVENGKIDLFTTLVGFRGVSGTIVRPLNGSVNIPASSITVNDVLNYVEIENQVLNSTITVKDLISNDSLGEINFKLIFSEAYNNNGEIVVYDPSLTESDVNYDVNTKSIKIRGFLTASLGSQTRIIIKDNPILAKTLFPEEINSINIENFISLVNAPINAKISYTFISKNNISPKVNDGSLSIDVNVAPIINNLGQTIPEGDTIRVNLRGFKSLATSTTVTNLSGDSTIYPQDVLEGNISHYFYLNNISPIPTKVTSISIVPNTFKFNNLEGYVDVSYSLNNYFAENGNFITKGPIRNLRIGGFKKVLGPTKLTKTTSINFATLKSSEIDININNYEDYFSLDNSIFGSQLTSITKKSFNDEKGEGVFTLSFNNGYIADDGRIVTTAGIKDLKITGFEMVLPNNDSLLYIIGGSIGSIILIAIIVGFIIWYMNEKRNKEKTNSNKIIPTTPSKINRTPPLVTTPIINKITPQKTNIAQKNILGRENFKYDTITAIPTRTQAQNNNLKKPPIVNTTKNNTNTYKSSNFSKTGNANSEFRLSTIPKFTKK